MRNNDLNMADSGTPKEEQKAFAQKQREVTALKKFVKQKEAE